MLKPAILYKEYIYEAIREYRYSEDMLLAGASICSWLPDISDEDNGGTLFQYAICNKDEECIGYLSYTIDWYASCAYNFILFSFDRGNPSIGKEVFKKIEELLTKFHRIEWRAVSGNPAIRSYDRFCKKHNGNRHVFKDSFRDYDGNYRDDIIYEILTDN